MKPIQIKNDGGAQYRAHNEWASRPGDERFLSLVEMQGHFRRIREQSRATVVSNKRVELRPQDFMDLSPVGTESNPKGYQKGLALYGPNGHGYEPNNWSFGQLATLAGAPAGYLRTLPEEMACDCINYGLQFNREVEEIGILLQNNGRSVLRAATGPNYGRIWNSDVIDGLVKYVGDGVSGTWRVPGEFGKRVEVTRDNTTLYASDRDMFVFLADEENRITVPGHRAARFGQMSSESSDMARGIYVWNSEVGAAKFGLGLFYFDFVCCNRIVWGMEGYKEFSFRHSAGAPDRFLRDIQPALRQYAQASSVGVQEAIEAAKADKLNDVQEFLAKRFGPKVVRSIQTVHELEEERPIETRWDAVVGATAYAKSIEYQDARVDVERVAGQMLKR